MSASTREAYARLLKEQPVLPAPMCGISDFAYRALCREFGGAVAYTQMVAAEGLSRDDRNASKVLDFRGDEPDTAMQVFGCDPAKLAVSARKLQAMGAVVVDLNMGCPARKVTGSNGGSALLRQPDLVRRIFREMRAALDVPFTVKMRWDWEDDDGAAPTIARIAEEEGLDGVCLHARTREQGYSGRADWSRIARLKREVSIPVVGNGDVRSGADAVAMIRETGCDAVMLGRGIIGSPWVLREAMEAVRRFRETGESPAPPPSERGPAWEDRREIMRRHARAMLERKGPHGLVEFRKHAAAYVRGVAGVKRLRTRMMRISDLASLDEALDTPLGPDDSDRDGAD